MSIEDELRDSLRRRAAAVRPHADLADVSDREAKRDRRARHLLTAGLVVALIAGPLAGFAIAERSGGGDGDVIAKGSGDLATDSASAGDMPVFAGTGQPLEQLFVRTTADGVVIRAYRTPIDTVAPAPVPGACGGAAEVCALECVSPSEFITGELSTDAAVTFASGNAAGSGTAALGPAQSWGMFGEAEGAPARWVLVSTGTDVSTVRATFPNGPTDEMEPVNGVALLAANVAAATGPITVEALDAGGAVLDTTEVGGDEGAIPPVVEQGGASGGISSSGSSSSGVTTTDDRGSSASASASASSSGSGSPSSSAGAVIAPSSGSSGSSLSCAPIPPSDVTPPTLPPPGEQPTDPTSARDQIEQAFVHTYDGSQPMESREGDVENGDASKVRGDIEASPYADDVTRASATVSDVVFTSPTEASVLYDISVKDGNQFPGRLGKAVLVDGTWKVSGETLCRDLEELLFLKCPTP